MSWAKRNLYFLISCVLAVALLGAAGWYCYSEWQGNNTSGDSLKQAYSQLDDIGKKSPTPSPENVEAANKEAKRARELAVGLRKHLVPIPSIPNTNNVDDKSLAAAVRDTVRQMAASAEANHVALPQDFAFSFSAQRDKIAYAAPGRDHLARQLGEIKVISGILFSNRIDALEVLQRERSADDTAGTQNEFLEAISVTNGDTIITPYQLTFTCFDPALSEVLAGFANQPYGIMVRTLEVEPAEATPGAPGMMAPTVTPGYPGMPESRYQPSVPAPGAPMATRGGLPVVVDEQKLRVTMLLELVRIVPTPGK